MGAFLDLVKNLPEVMNFEVGLAVRKRAVGVGIKIANRAGMKIGQADIFDSITNDNKSVCGVVFEIFFENFEFILTTSRAVTIDSKRIDRSKKVINFDGVDKNF